MYWAPGAAHGPHHIFKEWADKYKGKFDDGWDANQDVWELYNITNDFSQAENLAAKEPKRLEEMKALFLTEAKENKVFPIGAGIWLRIHPEDRLKSPYTSWRFDATTTRMP